MKARILHVLLLAGLSAAPATADWRSAHKLGVEAVEAGRWEDAERFFRAAIGERSEERIVRLTRATYLPHYYLGLTLAEQGRCRDALQSWKESERQGVIQKSKLAEDLTRRRDQCEGHLARAAAAADAVGELLETAASASEALLTLSRAPELAPLWTRGPNPFSARQLDAAQKLETARQHHRAGAAASDMNQLDDARILANEATESFRATLAAARKRLGELNAATASALETLEQAEESARRVLRSISDLAPYPRRLAARVGAVEGMLRTIADTKSGAGANTLESLTDELTVALAAVRRAARRPPEKLSLAAEAFFGGRFEETLELTEDDRLARDERALAHVCLLRAAARHALYTLAGESDPALLESASDELVPCREIDAPVVPGPKYFSPRFIAFYESSMAAFLIEKEGPQLEAPDQEPAASSEEGR